MNVLWPNGGRDAPRLGSGYGPRESFWTPGGWTNPFHYGQDCTGFDLNRAIADGVVTYVGYNGGYGNFVRVKHDDGYSSGYAHAATGGSRVSVGQRVTAGTPVSVMGTTGRSTGVHLHFEVYAPDGDTVDPAAYVRDRLASTSGAGSSPFIPTTPSEEEEMKPFIAVLPGGRWVLVLPQGNAKPRAVTMQGNAGDRAIALYGQPIPFDEEVGAKSLALAVDGV